MGTLVFQATLGGSVNLLGPNIATNINFTLPSADGTNGQALTTNGSGVLAFSTVVSAPAGSNTQVQFNNSGAFGASSSLTWNGSVLTSAGFSGPLNGTVGATTANTGNFTTLTTSSTVTLNGGTASGVTYLNGSKVLTSGSALTFDGTNLGIGTTSPDAKLDVTSAGTASTYTVSAVIQDGTYPASGYPTLEFNGFIGGNGYRSGIGSIGGQQLAFYTPSTYGVAPTRQMTLNESGNLGLGVTPSAWGSGSKGFQVLKGGLWHDNSQYFSLVNNAYYDGTNWKYISSAASSQIVQILGESRFYNAASGTAGNNVTYTQAMTLDASGNLSIGTTTITSGAGWTPKLVLSDATAPALIVRGANSQEGSIGCNNGVFIDSLGNTTGTNNNIIFRNTSTNSSFTASERARITSDGNLLVGKTSASLGANGFEGSADGTVSSTLSASTSATSTYNAYSSGVGAFRFYVDMGGTVHATSIVITAISDQRLKENVRDIETGLDSIMALKPRRFDWKEGKGQDKKNVAGFIAQEFETVFPECVSTSKAGADGIEYKNINHETLIPTLVKAIQELKAEFDAYKASHP